ncbi:VTT domain-containing protein [Niameybacter massiliensis]|uniref:TVP38/TMEM64 family membrane protein n=1 Tax=Holtiella tumoricola TaxID=3018743 RepID=A0AA42DR33_9FIRM|nr:VTT domain-containing protein [Holtiella tumoricola]MDA3733537.1 VTT domain-containing protein [Holtiella tumoricola]
MEQTTLIVPKKKSNTFSSIYKFSALIIIVGLIMGIGLMALPYAQQFLSEEGRMLVVESLRDKGIWGMMFFVVIQIIQVVIFIIPGEAVEVLAGMLYGTWWGYIVCQIGLTIGSVIIFYLVKGLGYDFIKQFINESKFEKLQFLQNNKKIEKLVFILFFIPGTPKDILTYFIPFTDLSLSKFLLISFIARVPAVISSTFAGDALQQGKVGTSVITFIVVGIVSAVGIWINRKFMKQHSKVTAD